MANLTPQDVVRDMYNPNENRTKTTRERNLRNNQNILFKIMRRERLHVLLFDPADAVEEWLIVIKKWLETHDLSVQLTTRYRREVAEEETEEKEEKKRSTKAKQKKAIKVKTTISTVSTFNLSGQEGNLEAFCRDFPNLRMRVVGMPNEE